ncbi:hypothetical protein GALL_92110 [mine drainage metagenome]|uniref:Uncharacterized protein n=1 Tax=mine drainage metagenome TaxID=410659 RepID=A0A1J5SIY5_9ZZZZ
MKLDRIETFVIIICIWASSFLTGWMYQDWARALGASVWMLLIGWVAVGTINRRRAQKIRVTPQEQVSSSLDLSKDPETPWVETLVKARTQMPVEEYEKFERAVLMLVENIGVVNRGGLKTQAEKMALLEQLGKSSAESHD